jgi:hypothetical protein
MRTEFKVKGMRSAFERSGNPYYAWKAIDLCVKADLPLPIWLIAYLSQCSGRMLSDKAIQASDLRKILPWILGFPNKRGPGRPLNPYRSPLRLVFAIKFGILVLNGENPVTARRSACNFAFDSKAADVDDKTLMRWVLEDFNLKKAPENSEEWQEVAHNFLLAVFFVGRAETRELSDEQASALAKQFVEWTESWTESRETLT